MDSLYNQRMNDLPSVDAAAIDGWIAEYAAAHNYFRMFELYRVARDNWGKTVKPLVYEISDVHKVLEEYLSCGQFIDFCTLNAELSPSDQYTDSREAISLYLMDADWRDGVEVYAAARKCSVLSDLMYPYMNIWQLGEIMQNRGFIGDAEFVLRACDCDPRFPKSILFHVVVSNDLISWKVADERPVDCRYVDFNNSIYIDSFFLRCSSEATTAIRGSLPSGIRLSQRGMLFVYCVARMCGAGEIVLADIWQSSGRPPIRSGEIRYQPLKDAEKLLPTTFPYDIDGRLSLRRITRQSIGGWYNLLFKGRKTGSFTTIDDLDYVASTCATKL